MTDLFKHIRDLRESAYNTFGYKLEEEIAALEVKLIKLTFEVGDEVFFDDHVPKMDGSNYNKQGTVSEVRDNGTVIVISKNNPSVREGFRRWRVTNGSVRKEKI